MKFIQLQWTRPSYPCDTGTCVEVSMPAPGQPYVMIRQSNWQEGPLLKFTVAEWEAFVSSVRDGEFSV